MLSSMAVRLCVLCTLLFLAVKAFPTTIPSRPQLFFSPIEDLPGDKKPFIPQEEEQFILPSSTNSYTYLASTTNTVTDTDVAHTEETTTKHSSHEQTTLNDSLITTDPPTTTLLNDMLTSTLVMESYSTSSTTVDSFSNVTQYNNLVTLESLNEKPDVNVIEQTEYTTDYADYPVKTKPGHVYSNFDLHDKILIGIVCSILGLLVMFLVCICCLRRVKAPRRTKKKLMFKKKIRVIK